jgi:hypothetical protein
MRIKARVQIEKIDAILNCHLSTLILLEQSWIVCSKTPASLNTFCPRRRLSKFNEVLSPLITKFEHDIMAVRVSVELQKCAAHRSFSVGCIRVEPLQPRGVILNLLIYDYVNQNTHNLVSNGETPLLINLSRCTR